MPVGKVPASGSEYREIEDLKCRLMACESVILKLMKIPRKIDKVQPLEVVSINVVSESLKEVEDLLRQIGH